MIIWDEELAEILEDGFVRRSWALELRQENEQSIWLADYELVAA